MRIRFKKILESAMTNVNTTYHAFHPKRKRFAISPLMQQQVVITKAVNPVKSLEMGAMASQQEIRREVENPGRAIIRGPRSHILGIL